MTKFPLIADESIAFLALGDAGLMQNRDPGN